MHSFTQEEIKLLNEILPFIPKRSAFSITEIVNTPKSTNWADHLTEDGQWVATSTERELTDNLVREGFADYIDSIPHNVFSKNNWSRTITFLEKGEDLIKAEFFEIYIKEEEKKETRNKKKDDTEYRKLIFWWLPIAISAVAFLSSWLVHYLDVDRKDLLKEQIIRLEQKQQVTNTKLWSHVDSLWQIEHKPSTAKN